MESDDEELLMHNDYDNLNNAKKEFQTLIQNLTHINSQLMGVGAPMRHPSYILGRQPEPINPQPEHHHHHERTTSQGQQQYHNPV